MNDLRHAKFMFFTDPGHGWLEVDVTDLAKVGLTPADFTHCSYRSDDGSMLYLEEDCDYPKFRAEWTARFGTFNAIEEYHADIFIRRLPRNDAGRWKPFGGTNDNRRIQG